MEFLDAIREHIQNSPFLNSGIDITKLMGEYTGTTPFRNMNLPRIMSYCNNIFDQTYWDWKESEEHDINRFFRKKAKELEEQGDVEHSKLLMILLADRLNEDNPYLCRLELEILRDKIIKSCEDKTSLVHKIDWPQKNKKIQESLEEYGWIKIMSCSRQNPIFYWHPFYNMRATIGESTLYID